MGELGVAGVESERIVCESLDWTGSGYGPMAGFFSMAKNSAIHKGKNFINQLSNYDLKGHLV
jgi:hypothetical protein